MNSRSHYLRAIATAGALLFLLVSAGATTFTVQVGSGGDRFSPSTVTVKQGDTVQWVWKGNTHSSTSGTPGQTTGLWDSGIKNSGATFSHTFSAAGSFPYFCTVHGSCCNMTGTVVVTASTPSPTPTPSPSPTPTPTPTPTPSPTPLLPLIGQGPVKVHLETIASGLTAPDDLVPSGDGRLFVVEQTGEVRLIKNDALVTTPFLNVSARLVPLMPSYDERGLLGFAFHPGFSDSTSPGFRKFYTYTSEPVAGAADFTEPDPSAFDHQSVIAEWQVSATNPDLADPASRREVLRIDEPQFNHNGGKLAFRPGEPYLYISLGDGGNANDVGDGHNTITGNGQDLTVVLGKILRIDPLDPSLTSGSADPVSANGKYRVPASNPFAGSKTAVHEIYAYGLRNPFRFSFDAETDRLIVGDVGQNNVEEVDFVEAGKNYGWNLKEGTFLFNPDDGTVIPDPSPDPSLIDPILEYSHSDGIAVLGGFIDRGAGVAALNGLYVFGDLSGTTAARLFYSDFTGGLIQELRLDDPTRLNGLFLKGFGTDNTGEVYALIDSNIGPSGAGGEVDKIVSITPSPAFVNLSTRLLVETGENVLIGGFIITGSDGEDVVLRGIGPSLSVNGQALTGLLPDPKIELHDGTGAISATNDNWMDGPDKMTIQNDGLAPKNDLESALLAHLQPGNYTVILSDAKGASGIGLVELYAVEATAPANPVNISTRGFVQTGDNILIGGFIIGGTDSHQVIVRGIGPSLSAAGINNPLLDPTLELHDGQGMLLMSNDDWRDTQEADILATGLAPSDDRESAILMTLAAGNYTAVLRGASDTTGVALVEAFQLQ